jgi:hypothetical protein
VFSIGQALGRRFRRVPLPPITKDQFKAVLDKTAAGLNDEVRESIQILYEVHRGFEPPMGIAPFLEIGRYVLAGISETVVSDLSSAAPPPLQGQLLAEGYLSSLGSWLARLDDDDFEKLRQAVGTSTLLTEASWTWVTKMRPAL